MKSIFFTTILFIGNLSNCFSQDVIAKKSGEIIFSTIIEINNYYVSYKNYGKPFGQEYSTLNSEIYSIQFKDGSIRKFEAKINNAQDSSKHINGINMYMQGQSDATHFYKGYRAAMATTMIVSLASPVFGLIPALSFSSTTPKESKLNYPSSDLFQNIDYKRAYTHKAQRIKQSKVWRNYGIALGLNLSLSLALFHQFR